MKQQISNSGLSIYDLIDPNDSLFLTKQQLQNMISDELVGFSLLGMPLRTRSKIVKSKICEALGYPIPKSFIKTQPRFLGQNFDVYTQKSNNLQIWNEEIDLTRRYVFLRISEADEIVGVKVIDGEDLVKLDKTGTLTHKYQATMHHFETSRLLSSNDTDNIQDYITNNSTVELSKVKPNSQPTNDCLMNIKDVYAKLLPLVGADLEYVAATQERNRGAELHKAICKKLGFSTYEDDGSYPDIFNQLIEVKLQTSPTIDLGLHSPIDGKTIATVDGYSFVSEDVRYVVFDASVSGDRVVLDKLYVVNGDDFVKYFPLFNNGKTNAKIQIPLPPHFFD